MLCCLNVQVLQNSLLLLGRKYFHDCFLYSRPRGIKKKTNTKRTTVFSLSTYDNLFPSVLNTVNTGHFICNLWNCASFSPPPFQSIFKMLSSILVSFSFKTILYSVFSLIMIMISSTHESKCFLMHINAKTFERSAVLSFTNLKKGICSSGSSLPYKGMSSALVWAGKDTYAVCMQPSHLARVWVE